MNPEARLKLELSEAQLEIQRLRERLSTIPPLPTNICPWYLWSQNGLALNQASRLRNFSRA
jgi:hypothetical protein